MKKKFIASALLLAVVSFTSNTAVFAAPAHQPSKNDRGRVEQPKPHNPAPSKAHHKAPKHNPAPSNHHHTVQAHHAPAPHGSVHVQNNYHYDTYYDRHYDDCGSGIGIAASILGILAIGTGIAAIAVH